MFSSHEGVRCTVALSSHLAKVMAELVLVHPHAISLLLALKPELEPHLAHVGMQLK